MIELLELEVMLYIAGDMHKMELWNQVKRRVLADVDGGQVIQRVEVELVR